MDLRIRERREALGLTQTELAKKVGKSFRTIQSWERGESYPNAEYVSVLCNVFGTDPNSLLDWYSTHPRKESTPAPQCGSRLMSVYCALSEEGREVADNVVAGLVATYPQGLDSDELGETA